MAVADLSCAILSVHGQANDKPKQPLHDAAVTRVCRFLVRSVIPILYLPQNRTLAPTKIVSTSAHRPRINADSKRL